jgi:magnesium-protoporphyrin O-methyltransferase
MDACGCSGPPGPGTSEGFASVFDERRAEADLREYRRSGPVRTTARLLELLAPDRRPGATLLDIGGGIGVLDQAFLADGAEHATLVEGSAAFVDAARDEAARAGTTDRLDIHLGDFVRLATELGSADVVTLDRVVCCYPDAASLVRLSLARARRTYGLVHPRSRRVFGLFAAVSNGWARLTGHSWRLFAHPRASIEGEVEAAGFRLRAESRTWLWRISVYERPTERA